MSTRRLGLATMIFGTVAAILGAALGALVLLVGAASNGPVGLDSTLPGASIVTLALGLGSPVAFQGWAAWRGRRTRSFVPTSVWWLGVLLALCVGLGGMVTRLQVMPGVLLPPLHAGAMALPPLILLWITGRALRGSGGSWREVIAGLGGGGLLGTSMSFAAEVVLFVAVGAVALVAVLALPGGVERVSAFAQALRDPSFVGDGQSLLELVLHPVVVVTVLGAVGVAIPLIEESLKTLAIGIVGAWARPDPARAFLWGVASGAGFAIVENLLNGAVAGQEAWVSAALTRLAASVMHCFTGGLVGWGWGQLWTGKRVGRFLGSVAGAVALHAFWNSLAVLVALLQAAAGAGGGSPGWRTVAGAGTAAMVLLLGTLAVALAIALPIVARRLAGNQGLAACPTDASGAQVRAAADAHDDDELLVG